MFDGYIFFSLLKKKKLLSIVFVHSEVNIEFFYSFWLLHLIMMMMIITKQKKNTLFFFQLCHYEFIHNHHFKCTICRWWNEYTYVGGFWIEKMFVCFTFFFWPNIVFVTLFEDNHWWWERPRLYSFSFNVSFSFILKMMMMMLIEILPGFQQRFTFHWWRWRRRWKKEKKIIQW